MTGRDSTSNQTTPDGDITAAQTAAPEHVLAGMVTDWHEQLRDGTTVLIRPIGKGDAALERAFVEGLSAEAREYRFLGQIRVTDDLVKRMTEVDLTRDMALIALHVQDGVVAEIGVGRFYVAKDQQSCECAVVVGDVWQHKGLGTLLMRHLIDVARGRGIKRMISVDMASNTGMRDLAASLGFTRTAEEGYGAEVIHSLALQGSESPANTS
jgi:GNAT superfamily N-acetyltransferase